MDNCQFTSVAFDTCNLVETEFHRTNLKGINFTSSNIAGIRISTLPINELRGAKVTSLQAIEIARMLGVIIEDI